MEGQRERPRPVARRGGAVSRRLWGLAGIISFCCGVIGSVLPLIPTVPFILLAAFCFARSSEKLDIWFRQTRLYNVVFSNYVERRTMTLKARLSVLIPSSILLALGFYFTPVWPAKIIIAIVWIGHVVYFGFMVKREPAERS